MAFKGLDHDGSNNIDIVEFRQLLSNVGLHLDDEECEQICHVFDASGDGIISLDEFMQALEKPSSPQTVIVPRTAED